MRRFFLMWLVSLVLWSACSKEIEKPTADAGKALDALAVGSVAQLDGSASSDPAGLPLAFSWTLVELPAGSLATLLNPATEKPYFTVDKPGNYRASLIVSNGVANSDPAFVTVTVSKCGSYSPVIGKFTVAPDKPNIGEVVSLTADVSHDDEKVCNRKRTEKYDWKLIKAPGGSATTIVASDTPAPWLKPDKPGEYTVSLVVTDDLGHASAVSTVTFTAGSCGQNAPVVAPADVTVAPNDKPAVGQTVQLSAKATDADTDPACGKTETFTYQWSIDAAPAGSKVQLNLPTAQNPSMVIDKEGTYTVRVVVKDALGHPSDPVTHDIVASKCGSNPPTVAAITMAPAAPSLGKPVQVSIAAADLVDADTSAACGMMETFSYAWSFVSLPTGSKSSLNAATSTNPSFTPDVGGDYVVGVVVSDTVGHKSDLKTTTITVSPCGSNAPVVTAVTSSPVTPNANDLTQLTATVADADSVAPCNLPLQVSYSWVLASTPQGSKAKLSATNVANPSFKPDLVGNYGFALVVTDAENHTSAIKTQTVTTTNCGASTPVAGIFKVTPVGNPGANTNVQLNGNTSTDADNAAPCSLNQTLSYSWSFLSLPAGSNATFNNASVINPSFNTGGTVAGNQFVVGLVVTDSTGLSSSMGSFTVTTQ